MLYAFGFERVGVVVGRVRADELGRPPRAEGADTIRTGWL